MPDDVLEISDTLFSDWDDNLSGWDGPQKSVTPMRTEAEEDIFGMSDDEFDAWLAHCERNN